MIGIIDYGLGNLASVAGAIERLGFEPRISADAAVLDRCEKLILPGVGAFGDGMAKLAGRGLIEPLKDMVIGRGRPFLGICLGAQLICKDSEEFGHHQGLGWVPAKVRRIRPKQREFRIPHVGWNDLMQVRPATLMAGVPQDALMYYVHSYCIQAEDPKIVTGVCDYGGEFVSALAMDNVHATQFHPEKSQRHGLAVLENFLTRA